MNFRTKAPQRQTLRDFKLPSFKRQRLPNRQPVYWLRTGQQDMLFLKLIFQAGAWYEHPKYSALFLADMFLEGTHTKNHRAIRALFDQYGATCKAQAGKHTFTIDLCCLNKQLDLLLDQLVDLTSNCSFPVENWARQMRIKSDNLKYQEEKTDYLARQQFFKEFYTPQHPYYGFYTAATLKEFDLQHLKEHYQNQIKAAPFQIILVGGITEANLKSIDRTLGHLAITEMTFPPNPPVKNHTEAQTFYLEKPEALQTSIVVGKYLQPMSESEEAIFKVLATILGGYFGSRLMRNLREVKGYTYGTYCQPNFLLKARSLIIRGDFLKAKREEVIAEIEHEIERLKTELVGGEELDRVKNYMAGSYLKSFNTPEDLIRHLNHCLLFGLEQNYRDQYISDLQNITAQDLQTIAQKHLAGNWLKVLVG